MKFKSNTSLKSKLLNSSKKIVLVLGTIGLANYSKFTETINPIPLTTKTTETPPWPALTLSITSNKFNRIIFNGLRYLYIFKFIWYCKFSCRNYWINTK